MKVRPQLSRPGPSWRSQTGSQGPGKDRRRGELLTPGSCPPVQGGAAAEDRGVEQAEDCWGLWPEPGGDAAGKSGFAGQCLGSWMRLQPRGGLWIWVGLAPLPRRCPKGSRAPGRSASGCLNHLWVVTSEACKGPLSLKSPEISPPLKPNNSRSHPRIKQII